MNRRINGNSEANSRASSSGANEHAPNAGAAVKLVRPAVSRAGRTINTDTLAVPWAVLSSMPFTSVIVHEHAGHLLIDFQSSGGSMRLQLTRRDLPVVLKTFVDAVSQLAAVAE